MDTTKTTTHVSLCTGYGGIDLGLKRAVRDLRTVAFSEIEGFACANLVSKMEAGQLDAAPIWTDLKTFPWGKFRDRVDILSGGYPCQPFSAAGKRLGKEDPRHLWPWIADGIRAMRPRLCFFENVEGHISLGLRDVVEELASIGYETTWGIFSAAEVGAPHQRKRVFILSHRKCAGLEGLRRFAGQSSRAQSRDCGASRWPSRPGQAQHEWEPPRLVGDTVQPRPSPERPSHREQNGSCESSDELGDIESVEDTSDSRLDGFPARHEETSQGRSANEESSRNGELQNGPQGSGGIKSMGDTKMLDGTRQAGRQRKAQVERASATQYNWQTEPALGGDAHGSSRGLDYAELCVTCDNRTDELRLLGNGVVPATAELAFRTLCHELITTR